MNHLSYQQARDAEEGHRYHLMSAGFWLGAGSVSLFDGHWLGALLTVGVGLVIARNAWRESDGYAPWYRRPVRWLARQAGALDDHP